ncbi:P-loop containing nucleoside triphosphate hydrolase protein [Chaetomium sp. MPI-SDFR-AT-0129]|nr:P-loop containing nucleoside triphosphate hydrolase protein [Chaetomium sp. MPI-SDFR-AT-0129]
MSSSSAASCGGDRPASKEVQSTNADIERGADSHFLNTTVRSLAWKGITVTVKDRETGLPKNLVDNVDGFLEAGEVLAILGPSGSGKTTLLNHLATRHQTSASSTSSASSQGTLLLNGQPLPSISTLRSITRFVEQEDSLVGALTVRETLAFTARLSTSSSSSSSGASGSNKKEAWRDRASRIEALIDAFGLRNQADALVGTPLRKGISGGQKRRLGVACQLVTAPRVLVLDEPTSGLDSVAGWEVIKFLGEVAKRERLIVIASIHQPSTATFNLFDKILLMSRGKTHYFGPVRQVAGHYEAIGYPIPLHVNPAEFLLEMTNTDFAVDRDEAGRRLEAMQTAWTTSEAAKAVSGAIERAEGEGEKGSGGGLREVEVEAASKKPGLLSVVLTLLHRNFVKSYRDVVVYGIRLAMYFGLAIMMGTVWLRLDAAQESIIPFINAIFFGSAFMSFMACAYSPAYLEDYMQFIKEKRNGLSGATAMIISNFLIGVPYLFIFSLIFSAITYWLSNFQPTAQAFFTSVLWIFLDLVAAESLVVLLASIFPSFVVSLALIAFANGLWMSVDGFMVPPTILNVFYRYVFHFWDYQKYVFENMMVNEFSERVYTCATTATGCQCMWQTDLADQCLIRGQGVLDQYGYQPGYMGKDVGIMMGIIAGYRIAAWIVLKLKS